MAVSGGTGKLKKYLIFYFERDERMEILRILYAAQDIGRF